jgi:hypothetical protein
VVKCPALVAGLPEGVTDFCPFHPWKVRCGFLQAVDLFTWDDEAVSILEFQAAPELFDMLEARDM